MFDLGFRSGLTPQFHSPPLGHPETEDAITEEAGLQAPPGQSFRVALDVGEGDLVSQGAPVARLRGSPDVCFVAPMPARIARVELLQGHRLSEIVLFREPGGDVVRHDLSQTDTVTGLRRLIQKAGAWSMLERRPFGGLPDSAERPAAIFVMATDTSPLAPDPRDALRGREEAFGCGLHALRRLTDGPVFVCQQPGPPLFENSAASERLRIVESGPRHPQGSVGLRIHAHFPAAIETPVWDIQAEDVARIGTLIATGRLPMTHLVSVSGAGLRESRLVHTQPGADLRGLSYRIIKPGAHEILSGSPLEGRAAQWLAPRDRQVTVLPRQKADKPPHWLVAALTNSATPDPVIPNAALHQAFGAALPAAAFVRALTAGDDETAMKMGILSLLEPDVALADYALGGNAHLAESLRAMLDRIRTEYAA